MDLNAPQPSVTLLSLRMLAENPLLLLPPLSPPWALRLKMPVCERSLLLLLRPHMIDAVNSEPIKAPTRNVPTARDIALRPPVAVAVPKPGWFAVAARAQHTAAKY